METLYIDGIMVISQFIPETFYFFGNNTFNIISFEIYESLCLIIFIQLQQSIPETILVNTNSTSVSGVG